MPELPEVELARRSLGRWAVGRRITRVAAPDPTAVRRALSSRPSDALPGGEARWRGLEGARPREPVRHGKRLGWTFDRDGAGADWLLHLGMTGKWVRREDGDVPRFAKLALELEGGSVVWFVDSRRFGCVAPLDGLHLDEALRSGLGPDALREPLDGAALAARMSPRRPVKTALMDQAVLAGLGNIHVAEALWRAGVDPFARGADLAADDWDRLAAAIPEQLRWTLEVEDTGEITYVTEPGTPNPFAVYAREGEDCRRCGTPVAKAPQGGRSTFWCPGCQPSRDTSPGA